MASTPNYEGAKQAGTLILDNALGTSLSAAILTGVAAGTTLKEIRLHTGSTTAPGSGTRFLAVIMDDGVNQTIIDIVFVPNSVNTQIWPELINDYSVPRTYDNVFVLGTGCSIKFQLTIALVSGATIHCAAFGANY